MDLLALPEIITLQIFLELPGKSLHRCRQVSQGWNNFILKNIWESQYGRKMVEKRLENNWSVRNPKYEETEEYFDVAKLNFSPCSAASENYMVIRRRQSIDFHDIHVFNIKTKDVWSLDIIGSYDHIATEVNNNILACHLVPSFWGKKSTVKVWSMKNHELLFEEEVFELLSMLHDEASNILVLIQSDKIEVLSFDESSVSVSRCVNQDESITTVFDEVNVSRIAFPYILFSNIQPHSHSMFTWHWDENRKEISRFMFIENFEKFVFGSENGEGDNDRYKISDATYVKNTFVTITCTDHAGDYENAIAIDYSATSVIRVLNDNGEILRRIELKGQFPSVNIVLVNEHKILVDFEDVGYLRMFDLRELLTPGTNEMPYAILNIKSGKVNNHYVMKKTGVASFATSMRDGGVQMKELNFWNTEY